MSKIGIIISQEYKNRVAKKSFIILTFLMPILFVAIIFIPILLAQVNDDEVKTVAIIDQTGLYDSIFINKDNYKYVYLSDNSSNIKKDDKYDDFTAVVLINKDLATHPNAVTIYSDTQVKMDLKNNIKNILTDYVEDQKIRSYNIENLDEIIKSSKVDLDITTIKWSDNGNEQESSTELALIIGLVTTMLIYMFIFISGTQVMNSVVQEKTNRIIEVMVCSVKPFQLMMGKIISVALVCLTQFFMWIVLSIILFFVVSNIAGSSIDPGQVSTQMAAGMTQAQEIGSNQDLTVTQQAVNMLQTVNWVEIITFFILYFIGGYLLYASMFAAIGSAVDNETDTQQFMMPITIVILFALYAGIYSAENPEGPLAFWCSLIPFTSPIVMMVRIPFDVPAWQLIVSLVLLLVTFVGTTWLSAKIYRTGILMYGKKTNWKEIIKWLRY